MSKTPEELAEEFASECLTDPSYILNKAGFLAGILSKAVFLAGYEAAKDQYEAKIKELETELDNWNHEAIHGDEGL